MRDGDPHKNVSIHDMFERIVGTLGLLYVAVSNLESKGPSLELHHAKLVLDDLEDIMKKADQ